MKRLIEQCEKTWRRSAPVSPLQHLELLDVPSSPSETRPAEPVLLRFLRLSVLQSAADVLGSVRCPRPLVETGLLAWPTEDDVDGAAANVCRLQKAYSLTAADVVATLCSPVLADKLSPDDALSLGVHCSRCEPSAAAYWVKLGEDRRYANFFYYHLPELESSAPKANSTSWRAVHGAAALSPFAVEELSLSESRLWLVHDFLSPNECGALRREASELEPALVDDENGRGKKPDTRTTEVAWLENNGSARRVYLRAAVLTGLMMESAENHQVLNYAAGGHYNEHVDPLDTEEDKGERLATLLVYLSEVKEGGSTAFRKGNLSIRPRRGSALFRFNLKQEPAARSRQIDYSTTHGSCPVLRWSKWIATLWIREWSQLWDLDFHFVVRSS
ncbi:hypothetical protein HPB52_006614 [Rhipicephalus sanguineus]|uniref:Fe2OG dioxygenase domain-containing protein n=1 Tax=Rhipicephalus sanguineus TaxID=34632 RepID=A0A9D4T542_RHISA|nr:hypothetical protein HPB52_006614 [Rhipicephalus sanguineus]